MIGFDCHAHVYDVVLPIQHARYTPSRPAPLSCWLDHQADAGISGGVIVQVSFLGTDNRQLVDALAKLDRRRFFGVGVVPFDASEHDLHDLVERGIRGVRWNLVSGAAVPDLGDPRIRRFLDRLKAFGLHLEVQLESPYLAGVLDDLAKAAGTLVIDHMGLPVSRDAMNEPWLDALQVMPDRSGIHVKLSAPYRSAVDPRGHIDRLMRLLPQDRFVWGSDWPHTQYEHVAQFSGLKDTTVSFLDDAAAVASLYGLQSEPVCE